MIFALFSLASYGLCFGVMNDKIPGVPYLRGIPLLPDAEGKNFFVRMFECPYCTGFHTGWILWLALVFPALAQSKSSGLEILTSLLCWGFSSSATCYILDTLIVLVERKTPQ